MRQEFFKRLHDLMSVNKDVFFVTGDLGYGLCDQIFKDFPERCFNSGAAEQAMMAVGIGLALEGKIPFVYSITPFLLYRPFEAIRNYIDHEQIPVIMVGSGRGKDYLHDQFSHWAEDDFRIMSMAFNIDCFYDIPDLNKLIESKKPAYINLAR